MPPRLHLPSRSNVNCAFCSNSYRNTESTVSFFKFPADYIRCGKWVQNADIKLLYDKTPSQLHKSFRLCSTHFEDNQFMNPQKTSLIKIAVPTLFDRHHPPKKVAPKRQAPREHSSPCAKQKRRNSCADTHVSAVDETDVECRSPVQLIPTRKKKPKMTMMLYEDRLESYDRNKDLGKEEKDKEVFKMTLPDLRKYKDINQDTKCVCSVSMSAIQGYLRDVNTVFDEDSENLYSNRFLRYIRIANEKSLVYFRSECRAQLKKTVTYKTDISIDADGCVLQGQCECSAGVGPKAHCKHVCAVLLAIHYFTTEKKIITEETYTSQIHPSQQCQPFTGSPIKAANLALGGRDINVNFDPRPVKFRRMKGYYDYFRNVCISYPSINSCPVSQLFAPANSYAVDLDHNYSSKKLSDMWLRTQKINEISENEILEIEKQSRGKSTNKQWFTKRLCASKFGCICKASQTADFQELAESLTCVNKIISAPFVHEQKHESIALKKYMEITGNIIRPCGVFVSKTHPFLKASPDGLTREETKLVVVKCPFSSKNKEITTKTVPYLRTIDNKMTLHETHDYFYQIQGQLFCCEKSECDLVVYTFKDVKIVTIKRNEEFIKEMVGKLQSFFDTFYKRAVLDKMYFKQYYQYTF